MQEGERVVVDGVLASERVETAEGVTYYLVNVPGHHEPVAVLEECIRPVDGKVSDASRPNFQANLKRYRYLKDMSQKELGEAIGVKQGAVWQWEHGKTLPSQENLMALCRVLGVSADALLTSEGNE